MPNRQAPASSPAVPTPVARPEARPTAAPAPGKSATSSERVEVHYDAASERILVAARRVPFQDLLAAIAQETGIHIESKLDLSEKVDWHFENVSLEEALDRLLIGYHFVALDDAGPGEPSPRSVWILTKRSTSPPRAQAVESLLRSSYATNRLDAGRRLNRKGSTEVAYALVDALARAQTWDAAESQFISALRDRVADDLCRSWGVSAPGPQAKRLRCE